jgi:hypothetical protein
VVAEVGVHDDDKVARRELQAVDVGGAEAELAGAGLEDDVRGVGLDELVGDLLGAVGGAVVDDDEFPVELAGEGQSVCRDVKGKATIAYLSVKVRLSSQAMMGRLRRSLYVGRMTEYLSLAEAFAGAIVTI